MMNTSNLLRKWLDMPTDSLRQKMASKFFYGLLVGFALLIFGDSLLSVLGHLLHLLIAILESVCEHLFQWLFKVSPRQAEIMTFWLGLTILTGLAWPITRKTHTFLKNRYAVWRTQPKPDKYRPLVQILLVGAVWALFS